MSVGVSSINRVSKQKVDATEKNASVTPAKKKAKTSTVKKPKEQKNETGAENKIYCLTEELPYYLL